MSHFRATVLALLLLASGVPRAVFCASTSETMHDAIAVDDAKVCREGMPSGKALLQVSASFDARSAFISAKAQHDKDIHKAGCLDSSQIRTMPSTRATYEDVKKSCCITSMIEFIRQKVTADNKDVCVEGCLAGLAMWHYCNDARGSSQDFASLESSLVAPSTCPCFEPRGSCAQRLADPTRHCDGFGNFADATLPPCTTTSAGEEAAMTTTTTATTTTTTTTTTTMQCPSIFQDALGRLANCQNIEQSGNTGTHGQDTGPTLVTSGDALVEAKRIYSCLGIQGTLTLGGGTATGISYLDSCSRRTDEVTIGPNFPPACSKVDRIPGYEGQDFTFKAGMRPFSGAQIDFAQLETLAQHPDVQNFTQNGYTVIVTSRGGSFSLDDVGGSFDVDGKYIANSAAQGENNGMTLVVFQTAASITLTKSPTNGRQFGPSIFAPLAEVTLLGDAGFIDGCVIAKTFKTKDGDQSNANQLQMHGDCYRGPLCK